MNPMRASQPGLVALVLAAVSIVAGGCVGSPSGPSSAPYSQTDLVVGSGATAASGSIVTVNYTGWFYDSTKTDNKGVQFDSSTGATPIVFPLGSGAVIQGWDKGLVGMQEGGWRRLVIPPSLAYGSARYASIPPNATLVFDIQLIKVE